jgi:hypothetical protein
LTDPTGSNFNIGCAGPDTATCQGGLQGTTTTTTTADANGNQTTTSTFTATEISNHKNGNLVDQNGNQYSGTFDGTNVSFTQNGSTQSSTGVWKQGTDPVSGIKGGGDLGDRFQFTLDHGAGQILELLVASFAIDAIKTWMDGILNHWRNMVVADLCVGGISATTRNIIVAS